MKGLRWPPQLGAMLGLGLGLGLGLVSGCPGSSTPPPTVAPVEPSARASLGDDVFVQASGRGATEDEAYAAAERALAQAVLGDPAWTDVVALQLHRRGVDPQAAVPVDGGVEVAVGLPRERVSAVVLELESGEPGPRGPVVWQEPLQAYLRAHAAAHACARRRVLFAVECETGRLDEVDAELQRLGEGLVLVSAYPDGVPVDAAGRPLRAPTVFVVWRGVPLAGLPMRLQGPGVAALASDRLVTDAQGRARVPLLEPLPEGVGLASLRLAVDGEALLGPYAEAAPKVELRIEPRPVGLGRWTLLSTRSGRAPRGSDAAGAVVKARLQSAGMGAPQDLAKRDAEALRTAAADRRAQRVAAVADAMSGRVDLLLVLTYDTRFASRMGGGRVWYEAEGTLEAVDAWTGEVRAQAKARVEADGVGDDEAAAAAARTLAEALTTDVLASLRSP